MQAEQLVFGAGEWEATKPQMRSRESASLVLVFGARDALCKGAYLPALREHFPHADIVSCSTGGQVIGTRVVDDEIVASALSFTSTRVRTADVALSSADDSEAAGRRLGEQLDGEGLTHVLVFAEGLHVNGSALARGLTSALPATVGVSGGLAADGEKFEHTLVGLNRIPMEGRVVGVGLYGNQLDVATGSFTGWQPFGEDRVITRSSGNVLYELDHVPALAVYKELLGPLGYALPASGLMFPLKIRESTQGGGVIRTILGVDEHEGSVTFAGDLPEGWLAKLVRTDLDQLVAGAGIAAEQVVAAEIEHQFVLAVSCIGRRMLLQQRVGEELHRLRDRLGTAVPVAGFYSYGELAPSRAGESCELHNQTMTVTCFGEREND